MKTSMRGTAVPFFAGVLLLLSLCAPSWAEPVQRLRIVGGLAGVNQYTRQEAPFWTQTLTRLTEGRVVAEIVPFDRAGIRGQEMLRLMQLGVVPFGTALLNLSATQEPVFGAPDLAGLNPDMASVRAGP
jgi:TRAP-type C4-dicarboxylate transport system substrate-binding protein